MASATSSEGFLVDDAEIWPTLVNLMHRQARPLCFALNPYKATPAEESEGKEKRGTVEEREWGFGGCGVLWLG